MKKQNKILCGHSLKGLDAYLISMEERVDLAIIISPTPAGELAKKIPAPARIKAGAKLINRLDSIELKPSRAKNLLIICGEKEPVLMLKMAKKLKRLNKMAKLVILKNMNHDDTHRLTDLLTKSPKVL